MSYLDEKFGLDGKTVVITGGGGAIAGALSEAFLRAGAKLVLWDIVQEALDSAKVRLSDLTGKGENIHCELVDTTDEGSVKKAIESAERSFAVPNVLVNAAGGNRGKNPFIETDMELFEFVLKLNLIAGLMVPTKVMTAHWIDRKIKGSVINLASMASFVPLSGVWAYDAAKAAVMNLTMASAKEFAPYGIRVNALAPGFFIGKQNRALLIKNDKTGELTERGKMVIDHTPFGRFGDVSELGGAVVFLTSDEASSFITGITLPIDGGYLIQNI
jgi:NAD(P)-dependent dehydrogenase (short-subunit alcohol dehydrogenase family)